MYYFDNKNQNFFSTINNLFRINFKKKIYEASEDVEIQLGLKLRHRWLIYAPELIIGKVILQRELFK